MPYEFGSVGLTLSKNFTKWDSFKIHLNSAPNLSLGYTRKVNENLSLGAEAEFKQSFILSIK